LLDGRKGEELRVQKISAAPLTSSNPELLWPDGERVDTSAIDPGVDRAKLEEGLDKAFAEPERRHTRALVVVHRSRIIAERYAPGFDAGMPLTGWSMAKTVTNALIGLRVLDGKIRLTDQALLPEWKHDRRRQITLSQLLCMTSGLEFDEDYDSRRSDVRRMLFMEGDKSGFAATKPLQHSPGEKWSYSSGTTNILARILRQSFTSENDYLQFPRERLFGPLGMQSAVFEPDAAGIFVGSSYVYASARDWARFGLFYLQDGVWEGKHLLPESWVADSVKPTCGAPYSAYGWQIWLKLDESGLEGPFPEDAFYMQGHDGQVVAIVPSLDLVIVRLGFTPEKRAWNHAHDLEPILQAF
jgi:CubicO group peptidase (beta-lactamase class C family)